MARIYKGQTPPKPPSPGPGPGPGPKPGESNTSASDLGIGTTFQSPDVGQKTRTAYTRAFGNGVTSDPSLGWGESRKQYTWQEPSRPRYDIIDEYLNEKERDAMREEEDFYSHMQDLYEELLRLRFLRDRWSEEPSLPPIYIEDLVWS